MSKSTADRERDLIIDYLNTQAQRYLDAYHNQSMTKKDKAIVWRNYAVYSSAAEQLRMNYHRKNGDDRPL